MTIGADQHIWHTKDLPYDDKVLFLAELAGPRAIHRTILIENSTDTGLTATLCYQSADVDIYPVFAEIDLPAGAAILANEKGFFPALGSPKIATRGDPRVLGGSCPGTHVWIEPDETPQTGYVYAEVSCQFDS